MPKEWGTVLHSSGIRKEEAFDDELSGLLDDLLPSSSATFTASSQDNIAAIDDNLDSLLSDLEPAKPPISSVAQSSPPPSSTTSTVSSASTTSTVSSSSATVTASTSATTTTTLTEQENNKAVILDYTKIPTELDKKFEALDEDNAIRATTINTANTINQQTLLGTPATHTLSIDEQERERNRTFDLLDALTRSGSLSIDCASLHVVIAATHCFDKSLMDTVIQDNINPIEKVERSLLILATTIQDTPTIQLINADKREDIEFHSPKLLT